MSSPNSNIEHVLPVSMEVLTVCLGFSKYVVNFEDDTPTEIIDTQIDLIQSRGGKIYQMNDTNSYKGFNAYFPDDFVVTLETHPKILLIEKS